MKHETIILSSLALMFADAFAIRFFPLGFWSSLTLLALGASAGLLACLTAEHMFSDK